MTDIELLASRLQILETRFRRMKIVAVIACVMTAALGIMGQAPIRRGDVLPKGGLRVETQAVQNIPVEAEIRSQHFVLVDDNGKERASLAADAAGSVFLVMFDAAGKTRVNLSATPQGPSLVLFDPSGQTRTVIGSTSLVGSSINENGRVERSPASSIAMFDRNGRLLHQMP